MRTCICTWQASYWDPPIVDTCGSHTWLDLLPSTSSGLGRGRDSGREGLGLILLTLWSLLLVLQGSV